MEKEDRLRSAWSRYSVLFGQLFRRGLPGYQDFDLHALPHTYPGRAICYCFIILLGGLWIIVLRVHHDMNRHPVPKFLH